MTKANSDKVNIAVMASQISDIKDDVKSVKSSLEEHYITNQEFDPVKKIVYGLVSLILVAVISALLVLVINK